MKSLLLVPLAIEGALAFGNVLGQLEERTTQQCHVDQHCQNIGKKVKHYTDADIDYDAANPTLAQSISADRTNCGAQGPCLVFSAKDQLISVHGEHAYKKPGLDEIRGPCPGLNAAANHNYLHRSGVSTIPNTIGGLGSLYGMDVDLAGFLAAYAIIFDGDVLTQTWSIGGPPPFANIGGLLGRPQGISWSHNKYEGDASIARCDAYTNHGDAHSLSTERFARAWEACEADGNKLCTLDKFSRDFTKKTLASIDTNPYYAAPLFSTTLVSPAAYNFVVNFMSNRTEENTSGYLTQEIFATFFGVTGGPDKFTWIPGQERVPENWYRRPALGPATEYTAVEGVFGDLAAEFAAYPKAFRFGGNTNGVHSFAGIEISNATGGVFNAKNLFEKNNLACFAYNQIEQGLFDNLRGGINDIAKATKFFTPFLKKAFPLNNCPKLQKFDDNTFNKYPGFSYRPQAKDATNC